MEAALREGVRRTEPAARRLRALSRRVDGDACHRAGQGAGLVDRVRHLMGRPAAAARRRDRQRRGATGAVPPAERQALRAQPLQERHLHDDRAGLRRQPERVLRVRPRNEEGGQLQSGERRNVAASRSVHRAGRERVRRQRRRRLLPRGADLRADDRGGEAEPGHQGARDDRLVHANERGLAAQA